MRTTQGGLCNVLQTRPFRYIRYLINAEFVKVEAGIARRLLTYLKKLTQEHLTLWHVPLSARYEDALWACASVLEVAPYCANPATSRTFWSGAVAPAPACHTAAVT
jgi:hypothetical protein